MCIDSQSADENVVSYRETKYVGGFTYHKALEPSFSNRSTPSQERGYEEDESREKASHVAES